MANKMDEKIIKRMANIVKRDCLPNSRSDFFVYDMKVFNEKFTEKVYPFVWATRECGTWLDVMYPSYALLDNCSDDDLRKLIANVKKHNLFFICTMEYDYGESDRSRYYFDGKKLRKITKEESIRLVWEYMNKQVAIWQDILDGKIKREDVLERAA